MPNINIQPFPGEIYLGLPSNRITPVVGILLFTSLSTSIVPRAGSLSLASNNAIARVDVLTSVTDTPFVGVLSFTLVNPTIGVTLPRAPPTCDLFFGLAINIIQPASASLTLSGNTALTAGPSIFPVTGALSLSGKFPDFSKQITPSVGTLSLTSGVGGVGRSITPQAGLLLFSGLGQVQSLSRQPQSGTIQFGPPDSPVIFVGAASLIAASQPPYVLGTYAIPDRARLRFGSPRDNVLVSTGSLAISGIAPPSAAVFTPQSGTLVFLSQINITNVNKQPLVGETYFGIGQPNTRSILVSTGSLTVSAQSPYVLRVYAIPRTVKLRLGTPSNNITPSVGFLTTSSDGPNVSGIMTPSSGVMVITGQPAPINKDIAPFVGSFIIQSTQQVLIDKGIAPSTGVLLAVGQFPSPSPQMVVPTGALSISGPGSIVGKSLFISTGGISSTSAPGIVGPGILVGTGILLVQGNQQVIYSSVIPSVGALSLTGSLVNVSRSITPIAYSLTASGRIVGLANPSTISTELLLLTGAQPILSTDTKLVPAAGGIGLVGVVSGLAPVIQPSAGSLSISLALPILVQGTVITASIGLLLISGTLSSIIKSIAPTAGLLSIVSYSPNISGSISPTTFSLVVNGNIANVSRSITPSSGAISFSGFSPLIDRGILAFVAQLSSIGRQPIIDKGVVSAPGLTILVGAPINYYTSVTPSTGQLVLAGVFPLTGIQSITINSGVLNATGDVPILSRIFPLTAQFVLNTTAASLNSGIFTQAGALTVSSDIVVNVSSSITPPVGSLSTGTYQAIIDTGLVPTDGSLSTGAVAPTLIKSVTPVTGELAAVGIRSQISGAVPVGTGSLSLASTQPDVFNSITPNRGQLISFGSPPTIATALTIDLGSLHIVSAPPKVLSDSPDLMPITGGFVFASKRGEIHINNRGQYIEDADNFKIVYFKRAA